MKLSKMPVFACAALAAVCAAAGTVVPYGAAPQQRGDLYLPDTVSAETPKLLLVHGGGWHSAKYQRGTLADEAELFRRAGYAVYNIDYRLAPAAPWPEIGDDCLAAARRFVACEGMPQLAPAAGKPVFVLGASAGGHLALMTGLRLPRKDVGRSRARGRRGLGRGTRSRGTRRFRAPRGGCAACAAHALLERHGRADRLRGLARAADD